MDSRELERLNKRHLLARLPGYAAKGALVFADPVGDVLRGLHFEPSGFQRDTRRVRYFVMPLYEPETYLRFTFARVLGGANDGQGDWWYEFPSDREPVMEQIADEAARAALPWLERVRTPDDLARRAPELHPEPSSAYVRQAVGLSLILSGDFAAARAELLKMRHDILDGDDHRDWLLQLAELGGEIAAEVEADPEAAVERLRAWRDAAIHALGLAKFARPSIGSASG